MSVLKEEVFISTVLGEGDRNKAQQLVTQAAYSSIPATYHWGETVSLPIDRAAAVALLEGVKAYVMANGRLAGKSLRPHYFDDFSYLDRSQPWWGFEFEMGWLSEQARRDALEAAWDIGVNGVTFDGEGEGRYHCEVTFAPDTMSAYESGEAPASRFMQYIDDHKSATNNTGSSMIGTHLNVSLPDVRNGYGAISSVLNNTIALMPIQYGEADGRGNVRQHWFGRSSLYMGWINQSTHMEGKLFRSTYDYAVYQRYLTVAKTITKVAQVANERGLGYSHGCRNFILMLDDPSLEPEFVSHPNLCGNYSRGWVDGQVRNAEGYYDYDLGYYDESAGSVESLVISV